MIIDLIYVIGIPVVFAIGTFLTALFRWGWWGIVVSAVVAWVWPMALVALVVGLVLGIVVAPFYFLGIGLRKLLK